VCVQRPAPVKNDAILGGGEGCEWECKRVGVCMCVCEGQACRLLFLFLNELTSEGTSGTSSTCCCSAPRVATRILPLWCLNVKHISLTPYFIQLYAIHLFLPPSSLPPSLPPSQTYKTRGALTALGFRRSAASALCLCVLLCDKSISLVKHARLDFVSFLHLSPLILTHHFRLNQLKTTIAKQIRKAETIRLSILFLSNPSSP